MGRQTVVLGLFELNTWFHRDHKPRQPKGNPTELSAHWFAPKWGNFTPPQYGGNGSRGSERHRSLQKLHRRRIFIKNINVCLQHRPGADLHSLQTTLWERLFGYTTPPVNEMVVGSVPQHWNLTFKVLLAANWPSSEQFSSWFRSQHTARNGLEGSLHGASLLWRVRVQQYGDSTSIGLRAREESCFIYCRRVSLWVGTEPIYRRLAHFSYFPTALGSLHGTKIIWSKGLMQFRSKVLFR